MSSTGTRSYRRNAAPEPTWFERNTPGALRRIETSRRLVDRSLLRLQGRVDTPIFDQVFPWFSAIVLGTVLAWFALARSNSLDQAASLAEAIQTTWLIENGFKPVSSLAGGNIMAEQASFVLYPVALLTAFLPRVGTLLVLQSAALAAGVIPLWRIARGPGNLRVGVTTAVLFAYGVYAAIHNVNIAGFHPEVFALPALIGAMLFGLTDKHLWLYACVAVVLLSRADLGLVIAGLGLLLAAEGKRRSGLAIAAAGIAWIFIAVLVLQPFFSESDVWPHASAFSTFGETPLEILGGIITNPIEFLRLSGSRVNFESLVTLLAPVLFLPVVALRYLLPALPVYAIYLAADVPAGADGLAESPQTIPMTAFVFIATVFAMNRSGRILVERVLVDKRVVVALLLTSTVFFVRDARTSPYEEPWNWADRSQADRALVEVADLIPTDANVGATERVLPLLSERLAVFLIEPGGTTTEEVEASVEAAVDNVDWIVFDGRSTKFGDVSNFQIYDSLLTSRGFEEVDLNAAFGYDAPLDDDGNVIADLRIRLYEFNRIVGE